jgi:hypothetical protein
MASAPDAGAPSSSSTRCPRRRRPASFARSTRAHQISGQSLA